MQSIVQLFVPALHDVHCAGQLFASPIGCASGFTPGSPGRTQKPSEQTRPVRHSACVAHVKSPLRWLIEQLPAVTTATPRTTSKTTTSFTACLRS